MMLEWIANKNHEDENIRRDVVDMSYAEVIMQGGEEWIMLFAVDNSE